MHALFCRAGHSLISRCGAVVLVALALSSFAFCGCRPVGIHEAAQNGNLERVKELLKANPDLVFNKDNDKGGTPLHWAARSGCKDVAELLLANKADVNAGDNFGSTPLHWAALGGKKEWRNRFWPTKPMSMPKTPTAAHLCTGRQLKATKTWRNCFWPTRPGSTPGTMTLDAFTLCSTRGQKNMVELLLANKAEVNARGSHGETPLHLATIKGQKDVVELLLANNARINARDNSNWTPLHCAAADGQKDVAELLLAKGADINARNSDGVAPLHLAALNGYKDVAETLLANKAGVNARAATVSHHSPGGV